MLRSYEIQKFKCGILMRFDWKTPEGNLRDDNFYSKFKNNVEYCRMSLSSIDIVDLIYTYLQYLSTVVAL